MKHHIRSAIVLSSVMLLDGAAYGQATVKDDGKWRYALGAGASFSSGNGDSTKANLDAEGVRATAQDKLLFYGRALYGESDDVKTDDFLALGARYDRNLSGRLYGFGTGEYLRDRPANLSRRLSAGAGLGYHVIKTEPTRWDVFGGVGYSDDTYIVPTVVAGELRSSYGRAELLLGEESTHKLTDTTDFKQRFVVFPNLDDSGEFRATFDAGLAVAMNKTMSLTVTLGYRYNSDPGTGLEKTDTLLVAGISVKLD
jgi:putative salt-induced outer membrane protein YdiY